MMIASEDSFGPQILGMRNLHINCNFYLYVFRNTSLIIGCSWQYLTTFAALFRNLATIADQLCSGTNKRLALLTFSAF